MDNASRASPADRSPPRLRSPRPMETSSTPRRQMRIDGTDSRSQTRPRKRCGTPPLAGGVSSLEIVCDASGTSPSYSANQLWRLAAGPRFHPSAREGGGDSTVDGKRGAGRRSLVGGEEDHRTADVRAGDLGVQQVPFPVEVLQLLRRNAPRPGPVGPDLPPEPGGRITLREHGVRVDHVHPDAERGQLDRGHLPELVAGCLGGAVRAEVGPWGYKYLGSVGDNVA